MGPVMRNTDLFQLALGLVPPWLVNDVRFDADKKQLDIEIDLRAADAFRARIAMLLTVRSTTPRCRSGGISTSSSIRRSCTRARRALSAQPAA